METTDKNSAAMSTHHEQAKKLRKLRTRQRVVSLIGIAILVWGIIQVTFLFLDYKNTESSNDAQIEQYISPVNLRASGYIKKISPAAAGISREASPAPRYGRRRSASTRSSSC